MVLSDPRCTTALMTRLVRPASPDSALQHGPRGRGNNEEEKRAFHQGPKALRGLQSEAGYMPASVLFRVSVQPPLGIGGGSIYVAKIASDLIQASAWHRLPIA